MIFSPNIRNKVIMDPELTVVELKELLGKMNLPVNGSKAELISRLLIYGYRHQIGTMPMKKSNVPENVLDDALYTKVRNQVKASVKVWPSAYASGQVVKAYKAAGGRYSSSKSSTKTIAPLDRWYKERWVNVCGRSKSDIKNIHIVGLLFESILLHQ